MSLRDDLKRQLAALASVLPRAADMPPITAATVDAFELALEDHEPTSEEMRAVGKAILREHKWFPRPSDYVGVLLMVRDAARWERRRRYWSSCVPCVDREGRPWLATPEQIERLGLVSEDSVALPTPEGERRPLLYEPKRLPSGE